MRVLIADKVSGVVPRKLREQGLEVSVEPQHVQNGLVTRLAEWNPEILVVRGTRVKVDALSAGKRLSLVIRAGAGVNTIDTEAAANRGIYVSNCPGLNATAVAELVIGHLINLDRRIFDNVHALREKKWRKSALSADAKGLSGRTLGVIGCGHIGKEVIRLAHAFGVTIQAWSRSLTPELARSLHATHAASLEEVVSEADYVSVHVPLTDETRNFIGANVFDKMREGAMFVNTSRAEVVDIDALLKAIETRNIRVGLDVFRNEPEVGTAEFHSPLIDSPNVYGTHHIGASTQQAEDAIGAEVVRIIEAYRAGKEIPNCVNVNERTEASHVITVRHADRVGVLARVLGVLREAGHNVQEVQNVVFAGSHAACARVALEGEPNDATISAIELDADVFGVSVSARSR